MLTFGKWRTPWLIGSAALFSYAGASAWVAHKLTLGEREAFCAKPDEIGPDYTDVEFLSYGDSVKLRGWLFRSGEKKGKSVLLVHGLKSCRTDAGFGMARLAREFHNRGYDVLAFDLRGCGTSDGKRLSLAHKEWRDVLGAYRMMEGRGYPPSSMVVVGISMGASAVLGAVKMMGNVGAVVCESAFASLAPLLRSQLPAYGLPRPLIPGVLAFGRLFFGVDPWLEPWRHVSGLPGRPFLFFHSSLDAITPVSHAHRLLAASAHPDSELFVWEGFDHVQAYAGLPVQYLDKLFTFIDARLISPVPVPAA